MNDELLKYYNRELTYMRHMGREFSQRYPKIAGRLRIDDEGSEDPHVSRLLEGFALLTAQIHQKLDDSFPELTEALLGQLYPDYQAPIPSMSILKMTTRNLTDSGVVLPAGSAVESRVEGHKTCHFRTCYDTPLWPIEVTRAALENAPFSAPRPNFQRAAKSVLKCSLSCEFDQTELQKLGIRELRFYLNGPPQISYALYQLLFKSAIGIAIASPNDGTTTPPAPRFLPPRHLVPVGFDDAQQVVPYQSRSFSGYRMLVEHFLFPEKFLFFELAELDPAWLGGENQVDLYIYFDQSSADLEKQLTAENLLLGCTPVINLFEQELEPLRLDPARYEYPLHPRYGEEEICEVVQITGVEAYDQHDRATPVAPFYASCHPAYPSSTELFWQLRREHSDWAGGHAEPGFETYLSVVDRNAHSVQLDEDDHWHLSVTALCSNRNLPIRLPYGGGQPAMSIPARADLFKEVRLLMAPTLPVRPELMDSSRWQLAKHLTLNHFSGEQSLATLQETLKLHDFRHSPQSKALIEAITSVKVTPSTARVVQHGRVGFCQGSDIEVEFNSDELSGARLFLFGTILSQFFAQYTAINSYTRLSVRIRGQDQPLHRWPATAGSQSLV